MAADKMSREAAEAIVSQFKAALAAGQDSTVVQFADAEMTLEHRSDGGFVVCSPGGGYSARMYMSPTAVPDDYPAGMPFVPGESVTSMRFDDSVSLTWWGATDPAELVAELDRQTQASGWLLKDESHVDAFQATNRSYGKEAMERFIMAVASTVTLIEKRVAPRATGA